MNDQDIGINIVDKKLSILLCADDIAMIANNEEDLQHLFNKQWGFFLLLINTNYV